MVLRLHSSADWRRIFNRDNCVTGKDLTPEIPYLIRNPDVRAIHELLLTHKIGYTFMVKTLRNPRNFYRDIHA